MYVFFLLQIYNYHVVCIILYVVCLQSRFCIARIIVAVRQSVSLCTELYCSRYIVRNAHLQPRHDGRRTTETTTAGKRRAAPRVGALQRPPPAGR